MTRYFFFLVAGLVSVLGFLSSPAPAAADTPQGFPALEAAYQSGQIDRTQLLYEEMTLFFSAPVLASSEKAGVGTVLKSGTGLIREVLDRWDTFSAEQQAAMAQFLARPGKQRTFDSPAGFFKIHFDTIGPEAVPPQDGDADGVPDYVERIAEYADSSRSTYISGLEFFPPPSDHGVGGDDRCDIYLLAISGYGATLPDSPGDSAWIDYSSYILIHRNLYGFPANDDPAGDTIGAQKVTCAHEVFHAVQLAYDRYESLWWMESGSTRMEEYVYPEVNDNYNYLPYFYGEPETSLLSTSGVHAYGAFVWSLFLDQKLGISVHRKIWEACRYYQDVAALDSGLAGFGASIAALFPEFALWNYHTGPRAIAGRYFPDASFYPAADIDLSFETLVHDSVLPVHPPQGLACNYIELAVDSTAKGVLSFRLTGTGFVAWAMTGVIRRDTGDTTITRWAVLGNPINIYLPFIEDYVGVTAIPTVISPISYGNDYLLTVSLYPYGDANQDRAVNVGDATYIVNYVFRGGAAPVPVWESGDANCDGKVTVADAVLIIGYIFRGGQAPCAGR